MSSDASSCTASSSLGSFKIPKLSKKEEEEKGKSKAPFKRIRPMKGDDDSDEEEVKVTKQEEEKVSNAARRASFVDTYSSCSVTSPRLGVGPS